jgi:hypothetical protein
MRKVVLGAVCAALCLSVGVASAINGEQSIVIKVTPSKAPKKPKKGKAKAANVKLFVETITKPAADDPAFATKLAVIFFDKNLVFNGKALKSCTQAQVQQSEAGCPKGSKVGGGKATGNALGQTENLTVTAFNGPGGNSIELHVVGAQPLVIDSVIEGKLQNASGKYGKKLSVPIPDNLQQPLTGVFATLTDFQTSVKSTGPSPAKLPYIGFKKCPTSKTLNFAGDFTYTDGTSKHAETTVKCT